ncbi:MAG: type II secretion system GspH family protein [Synergistaceae bacterium]|nr:type II secretion system GspH family protein [Synergistaceae bacterium]
MNLISQKRRAGFSLVELLLVIVIMAIITALVTLSGASIRSSGAQSEAKQIVRALQSLRSAWLAHYADKYVMWLDNDGLMENIRRYSDRSWTEEVSKYGRIIVTSNDAGRIEIGFSGPWNLPSSVAAESNLIAQTIEGWRSDYGINFNNGNKQILIRVR